MDLSTLKKNLLAHNYSTLGDALDDLQLIWTNCKTYNVQGSDIWKLANNLEKVGYKHFEKFFKLNTKEGKKMQTAKLKNEDINESVSQNIVKDENNDTDRNQLTNNKL